MKGPECKYLFQLHMNKLGNQIHKLWEYLPYSCHWCSTISSRSWVCIVLPSVCLKKCLDLVRVPLWFTRPTLLDSKGMVTSLTSLIIMLYRITHIVMILVRDFLSQKQAWPWTNANQACNTPKALSVSLRAVSWHWAKWDCFFTLRSWDGIHKCWSWRIVEIN
jgi:hypothetical protein